MINSVLQAIESFESTGFTVNSENTNEDTSNQNTCYYTVLEESGSESNTGDESGVAQTDTKRLEVKQSLKDKIKQRRESQGAKEIRNLFEPPKTYTLTAEEKLRNEIRKQRNRKSAIKSRLKRMHKEKLLAVDETKLEEENIKLVKEVETLTVLKRFLQQELVGHLSMCPLVNKNKIGQNSLFTPVQTRVLNHNSSNNDNILDTGIKKNANVDLCGLSSNASRTETFVAQETWNSVKHHTTVMNSCISDKFSPKARISDNDQDQRMHSGTQSLDRKCNVRTDEPDFSAFPAEFIKQSGTISNTTIIADVCEMHDAEIHLFGVQTPILTDPTNSDEQRIKQIKEHLLDGFVHVISENNCSKVCQ